MELLKPFKVLVVDDDHIRSALISESLTPHGIEVLTAHGTEAGFEIFLRLRPSIVLLDLLSPIERMMLLERMVAVDPRANVILISQHCSADLAVEAISKGACDLLITPLDLDLLRARIGSLRTESELRHRTLTIDQELLQACQFEGMVSRSPLMFEAFAKIRRVAPHFKSALISGRTGTGKELVARSLHRLSSVPSKSLSCAIAPHWSRPLPTANCSAM